MSAASPQKRVVPMSPYELLGVRHDVCPIELRKRYLHLCRIVHPDKSSKSSSASPDEPSLENEASLDSSSSLEPHESQSQSHRSADSSASSSSASSSSMGFIALQEAYAAINRDIDMRNNTAAVVRNKQDMQRKKDYDDGNERHLPPSARDAVNANANAHHAMAKPAAMAQELKEHANALFAKGANSKNQ